MNRFRYIVETESISRSFNSVKAVDGLTLRVPIGSVYAFLGPNGAGKTTTIRMLLGLIKSEQGVIRVFGKEMRKNTRQNLSGIGAMVESPSLYPNLSGRDNLRLLCRLTNGKKSRIDEVLDTVKLTKSANRLAKTYSTGMKQRLGLAMALLNEPQLLILDEPTNGFDPAGMQEMRDLLRELPKQFGVTIFLSSHLLNEVEQVASHIGIINNGKLLFEGSLSDFQLQTSLNLSVCTNNRESAFELLTREGWQVYRNEKPELDVEIKVQSDTARINRLLVNAGLDVYSLNLQKPTLEKLFLNMTNGESEKLNEVPV